MPWVLALALVVAPTWAAAQALPAEPSTQSVGDALKNSPDLQGIRIALLASPWIGLLDGTRAITLFAPTDRAFSLVAQAKLRALLTDGDRRAIGHHLVRGTFTRSVLLGLLRARGGQLSLQTVAGDVLGLTLDSDGAIVVDGVTRLGAGRVYGNGVVFEVGNVLLPTGTSAAPPAKGGTGADVRGAP